jgi:tetratricopeptide (TPR) repeat protein
MAKMRTALYSLLAVLAFWMGGRAEDPRAASCRAADLQKAGHSRESIPIYLEVLRSDPQCLEAEVGLGRSYYALGEYPQAEASFTQALQLRPGNADILNWLGRSYLQENKPEKVLELVGHEGASAGNSALIHLLRARAYDAQDKLEEARGEIERALKLDPRCHGAHFAQGFIAWSTDDLAGAERDFRQELDLDAHESLAAYYLADVLDKRGKTAEAESALTQMGQDAPNTYLYQLAIGKVEERMKKYPLAEEHYRQAIRLAPQEQEAHFHLAVVLRAEGMTAKANAEFQGFNQLQTQMQSGLTHGMGRMRPHLPDFD